MLADSFVRVGELEAERDKQDHVLERLRNVMAEQAVQGRLNGEELTRVEGELRLERWEHAAAKTQLEQQRTTSARVTAQLQQEREAQEASQTQLQEKSTTLEAAGTNLEREHAAREAAQTQLQELEDVRGRVAGKCLIMTCVPFLSLRFCD